MPLRRFLSKLLESSSTKEVDACKNAIKDELANLSKSQRDTRDLHAAVQQLIEVYMSKKADFIIDIVANFQETVANEFLRQLVEKILFAHKEYVMYSSGVTYSSSQSIKYYEMLCFALEFLLKVVSRGPWWNQLVISATWSAFSEIIRDRSLSCECYISVVFILSICTPYSIAQLDERLILWLCSIANTLLNRNFTENSVKAVEQQLVEENMKSSIMQLVLILYGIIPITFIRQLMQSCPSDVVDFVVSQLRLHPILSQHLAQRGQQQIQSPSVDMPPTSPSQTQVTTTAPQLSGNVIGGGGLSQAECKSKNRFRGKDFSDIVTECLNYEATSPPKMFSADFPPISLLASDQQLHQPENLEKMEREELDEDHVIESGNVLNGEIKRSVNRWSTVDSNKMFFQTTSGSHHNGGGGGKTDCSQHYHFVQHSFAPDWFHHRSVGDQQSYFYSCPASPTTSSPLQPLVPLLSAKDHLNNNSSNNHHHQSRGEVELLQLSSDTISTIGSTLVSTTPSKLQQQQYRRSRMAEMKAQKSLAQVNDSIRAMLSFHRVPRGVEQPPGRPLSPIICNTGPEAAMPSQYVKCYVKLAQLKSEGANETEMLKEQLRLAQLSLSWERHRSLIFICKNRSLMTEHKKNGELEGHLEEAQRRIHELETKLEQEIEHRLLAEQKIFTLVTQMRSIGGNEYSPLSVLKVNTANPVVMAANASDFIRANLSPRPRPGPPQPETTGNVTELPILPLEPAFSLPAIPNTTATSTTMTTTTSSSSTTGMHRAQSSGEFATSTTATGSNSVGSVPPLLLQTTTTTSEPSVAAMKRELEEVQKDRDDLLTELRVLRQQLRNLQLEALDGTSDDGILTMQGDGGLAGSSSSYKPSEPDEVVDRMELLAAQLNDSRREVVAVNELMAEMKSRLDVAESDRRRLSSELTRIALHVAIGGTVGKPQLAIVGSGTATTSTSVPTPSTVSSSTTAKQQEQNQYPTLKKQVEKILLKKQEIATTTSSTN